MQSWLSYWDAPNKSYVNERHKRAHYDVLLDGICAAAALLVTSALRGRSWKAAS